MADFDAMTVNERLFAAGLIAEFDAAAASKNLDAINAVLEKVGLRQDESGMNWSLEEQRTGDRKTLQLRDPSETADAAPAIKKKGRGWEISEKRLDALHDRAREMRRHSSPVGTFQFGSSCSASDRFSFENRCGVAAWVQAASAAITAPVSKARAIVAWSLMPSPQPSEHEIAHAAAVAG